MYAGFVGYAGIHETEPCTTPLMRSLRCFPPFSTSRRRQRHVAHVARGRTSLPHTSRLHSSNVYSCTSRERRATQFDRIRRVAKREDRKPQNAGCDFSRSPLRLLVGIPFKRDSRNSIASSTLRSGCPGLRRHIEDTASRDSDADAMAEMPWSSVGGGRGATMDSEMVAARGNRICSRGCARRDVDVDDLRSLASTSAKFVQHPFMSSNPLAQCFGCLSDTASDDGASSPTGATPSTQNQAASSQNQAASSSSTATQDQAVSSDSTATVIQTQPSGAVGSSLADLKGTFSAKGAPPLVPRSGGDRAHPAGGRNGA